jgi:hypothetical protein
LEEGKGKVAAPSSDMAQPSASCACRILCIAAYTEGIATALETACLAMTVFGCTSLDWETAPHATLC